ncbi:DUF4352 domain-containing protein [Listeria aquatica]|uniref:Lipoprotein n=1 Tax=Listeria aquatica FSL S10-1188 TaxID=1265818 RepID=W7B4Z9_9LIST|nr:DUF4352 domain-containing protein [Listeria aquatica]EUJ20977.1 lipoprotein [Listeria aquatica FSL S10-1188]
MKKRKVFLSMLVAVIVMIVATGCSSTSNSQSDSKSDKTETAKTSKEEMYVTKTVNKIDMKIVNVKTTENGKGDKNLVTLEMKFTNNDVAEVGVGAYDFTMKAKGKTYKVSANGSTFGDAFQPGKTLEGKVSFEIPKSIKNAKLSYTPEKKELAEWNIVIPEAK